MAANAAPLVTRFAPRFTADYHRTARTALDGTARRAAGNSPSPVATCASTAQSRGTTAQPRGPPKENWADVGHRPSNPITSANDRDD
jgi:hypothetical protein